MQETPYTFPLISNNRVCLGGCRFNVSYATDNDLRLHYILWHSREELRFMGYDRQKLKMELGDKPPQTEEEELNEEDNPVEELEAINQK